MILPDLSQPAQADSGGNTELTGISDETVADAPDLGKAVPAFLAWAGEGQYPLVAHNAGFDMGFLRTACQRLGIEREFTSIDTLEMSRLMLPHMHKFKLNILAKELQGRPVRAPPARARMPPCSAAFTSSC